MWEQLEQPWQSAINQAWIAYCAGSLPIGAAIVSLEGEVICEGRNRIYDHATDGDALHFRQHFMAHAEQNAFISLGVLRREQPQLKKVIADSTLYSTLEPCDMCIGTLIQSGVKSLHYLIPDPMGGAIDTLSATSHVREKHIKVVGPQPQDSAYIVLAIFLASMAQSGIPIPDDVVRLLHQYSDGVQLSKLLVQSGELTQLRDTQTPMSVVYNRLAEHLAALKNANTLSGS